MSEQNLNNDAATATEDKPKAADSTNTKKNFTRRDVLAMCGCGVAGLIVGGVVAKWGVTEDAIASGRIELSTTPQKMIVTDRGRCSGCQRCEMMCSLRNDGWVSQETARVRVWESYNFGASPDTEDGIYGNCQFTIKACKQCEDAWCVKYCPVHAIHSDEKTGARVVDTDVCIGCGMCHEACPWNIPVVSSETAAPSSAPTEPSSSSIGRTSPKRRFPRALSTPPSSPATWCVPTREADRAQRRCWIGKEGGKHGCGKESSRVRRRVRGLCSRRARWMECPHGVLCVVGIP